MSDADHRAALAALLTDRAAPEIAEALTGDLTRIAALPPAYDDGALDQPMLSPLGALWVFFGARALLRSGRGHEAWPWIETALDAYAAAHPRGRRVYVRHTPFSDALGSYPTLSLVAIEALIAAGQLSDAAGALADFCREHVRHPRGAPLGEAELGTLAGLAEAHPLGPLWFDEASILARQGALAGAGALDERKEDVWKVYADHLIALLKSGKADEAAAFVRAKADAARSIDDGGHYHFNAVCALAAAGHAEEAIAATRQLVRRGYDLLWRFDRKAAGDMWWTAAMGQLDWLAALEGAPALEALRERHLTWRPPASPVPPGPFKSARRDTLAARPASAAR